MPVGPKILCPEKTKKSASSAWTSTLMCEIDCAPSTSAQAPTRWAMAITSAIGVTVPSALETWVTETSLVRSLRSRWYSLEEELAVVVHRDHLQHCARLAPRAAARARCWRGARGGR